MTATELNHWDIGDRWSLRWAGTWAVRLLGFAAIQVFVLGALFLGVYGDGCGCCRVLTALAFLPLGAAGVGLSDFRRKPPYLQERS